MPLQRGLHMVNEYLPAGCLSVRLSGASMTFKVSSESYLKFFSSKLGRNAVVAYFSK